MKRDIREAIWQVRQLDKQLADAHSQIQTIPAILIGTPGKGAKEQKQPTGDDPQRAHKTSRAGVALGKGDQ